MSNKQDRINALVDLLWQQFPDDRTPVTYGYCLSCKTIRSRGSGRCHECCVIELAKVTGKPDLVKEFAHAIRVVRLIEKEVLECA